MSDPIRHFLDTNLLLGFSIEWDTHTSDAAAYRRETDARWFTCHRACKEGAFVVRDKRMEVLKSLRMAAEDFDVGAYVTTDDLYRFFRNQYDGDVPRIVNGFIQERDDLYEQAARDGEISGVSDDVFDYFEPIEEYFDLLDGAWNGYIHCYCDAPPEYDSDDRCVSDMQACIGYEPDRDIALDAHYLATQFDFSDLTIVSFDSHFTDAEKCVQSAFPHLTIRHPGSVSN